MKTLTEKTTLWIMGSIVLLSFVAVLGASELAMRTPSPGTWSVSFVAPDKQSLAFDITDFASPSDRFRWSLLREEDEIRSGTVDVTSEASVRITPDTDARDLSGKVTLRVTDGAGNTRELYKIFP